MTPIPSNPVVVVHINTSGNIVATASNISELRVVEVHSVDDFLKESCNRPFINLDPDTTLINNSDLDFRNRKSIGTILI